MANKNTIQLDVLLNDLASQGFKNLANNAEQSVNKMASAFEGLYGQLTKLAAMLGVAFGVYEMINFAKESIMLAARVETLGVVLNVVGENAGYSRGEMKAFVEEVKGMGITTQAAHDAVIKMAQAQINLSDSAKLARVAQDAAVIGNINSSEAFERMINGIRSGEVEILKTIGLSVNFETAYQKQARALNTTVDGLSEREKAQARANAVMEAGVRIEGAYEASLGTAGKALLSMKRFVEELQIGLGSLFGGALSAGVERATKLLKDMNSQMEEMRSNGTLQKISDVIATEFNVALVNAKNIFRAVIAAAEPLLPILKDWWTLLAPVRSAFGQILAALVPIVEYLSNAIAMTWDLAKVAGNALLYIKALATGNAQAAQEAKDAMSKTYDEMEKRAARMQQISQDGVTKALEGHQKELESTVVVTKQITEAERAAEEERSKARANAAAQANKLREQEEAKQKVAKDHEIQALSAQLSIMKAENADYLDAKSKMVRNEVELRRLAGDDEIEILQDLNIAQQNLAVDRYNFLLDEYEKEAALHRRQQGAKFNETAFWNEKLTKAELDYQKAIRDANLETADQIRSYMVQRAQSAASMFQSVYRDIAASSTTSLAELQSYGAKALDATIGWMKIQKSEMLRMGMSPEDWEHWFNVVKQRIRIELDLDVVSKKWNDSIIGSATNWLSAVKNGSVAFRKYLADAGSKFKETWLASTGQFISQMYDVMNFAKRIVQFARDVITFIPDMLNLLADLFETIGNLPDMIINALTRFIESIPKMAAGIARVFTEVIPTIIRDIPKIVAEFIKAIPTIINGIIESIPLIIEAWIDQFIKGIPKIIEALVKAITNATWDAPKNIISNVGGGIGDLFGGIGDVVSDIGDFFGFHRGGVVGVDQPTFVRSMPTLAFAGLPRLHAGLAPDEYPAILQQGERVLSRRENAAYERGYIFSELAAEIRALRAEVKAGNYAIARNTGKAAKILGRFDDDGLPAERALS